jgi:Zn-dependent protease with chaperone function
MLDETGARALIARQRVRTRVLGVVIAAAMLLNVGIVTLIVALASRSLVAAVAVSACIVVVAIVTTAVISQPQSRAVYLDADSSRPYVDRAEPVVARVAAALRVGVPDVRIADDAALNAFAAGDTVAYTQALLLAVGDEELAAVTAHVLSRRASGENSLAVFGYGMMAWALEPFDLVVMRLVRLLRRMGKACVNFAFGRNTSSDGDGAAFAFRLFVFIVSLALGLELLAAALALFLVFGSVALVGVLTLRALAWQRMRFADQVATAVTGPAAVRAALGALADLPTEISPGGATLQDLCFAGPRPVPGYVPYTPDLEQRIARLESGAERRNSGLPVPLVSAVALVALLGGLALATAKVPFGTPFGHGGGSVPVADAGGAAPVQALQSGSALGSTVPPTLGGTPSGISGATPTSSSSAPGQPPPVTSSSGLTGQPSGQAGSPSGQADSPSGQAGSPSPSPGASSSPSPTPARSPALSGPPAAPSGVKATPNGQYSITVTWVSNASNTTGFNIDNGCPPGSCQPGATLTQTTGVITTATFAVTPGSYQCFRVQAFNNAGSSAWSSYGCTKTPGFTLQGTQAWAGTGVTVPSGIVVGIAASGTVSVTSSYSVGPAGTQSCIPSSNYPGEKPPFLAANLPCWSLIGRIGNGPPFEIGTSTTITIASSGLLYLSVNDSNFADNSGSWLVDIKEGGSAT